MRISPEKLEHYIAAIFRGAGCGQDEAACVAEHLVKANLSGHDSHGVIRTPIYLQWLRKEGVYAGREVRVVHETETMALLDGQMGLGQWIGQQALKCGIEKCRRHGVAVIALRNTGHLGRIGHWAEMAADAGFVSLNFVNTSGLGMHVVPAGGLDKRLSVNPVAIGFPNQDEPPIILDIAAAATAEGKLKVARNKGEPVPEGWIMDAEGNSTTDPNVFYDPPGGAILPLGGHKGYGLGFMAELLAGALTGSGCSSSGKTRLEQGLLAILIDPGQLQENHLVANEVRRYVDFVRSARPRDPQAPVLAPGDLELKNRAERTRDGIELDDNTWRQINEAAESVGISQEESGAG